MSQISRDPLDIVSHTIGPHHQYPGRPDAVPRNDVRADARSLRARAKASPTSSATSSRSPTPQLGTLVNRVNHSDKIAPWTFGTTALMQNLAGRGLLGTVQELSSGRFLN